MTVSHKIKQLFQIRPTSAFTIVELLIVIVIIGILAAITVVAYNGITGRARVAALQSAATQAATKIELLKDSNGNYPTTVSSTDLPPPPNITYDYQPVASKGTYCLTATDPATGSYFVTSTGTKSVGPCPVAYFPLDGTAEDKSAYQNNGTNNGATATADRNGKAGGAMGFDGVNKNITLGTSLGLMASNVSMSCWIYNPTSSNKGAFIKAGVIDGYGIGIGSVSFDSAGTKLIMLYESRRWIPTPTNVTTGWHHIALTIDTSGVPTGYVDGISTGTYPGTNSITPSSEIFIGGYTSSSGGNRYFNGYLDDARIYNRALSEKEVKQLYEAN